MLTWTFLSHSYRGVCKYNQSYKHTGIHRAALLSVHRSVNGVLPFSSDTAKQQWRFSKEKCFSEQATHTQEDALSELSSKFLNILADTDSNPPLSLS